MHLMKSPTPILALVLASAAFVLSLSLCFASGLFHLSGLAFYVALFYYPAIMLGNLCAPSAFLEKGQEQPLELFLLYALFGLVQWYVIFVVVLAVHRFFLKRKHENVRAA
jgi:hypothetical protein